VIGHVQTGQQPSGMSITRDGKYALVANRADGTVTLLRITGKSVSPVETIKVCLPEESVSDVAISPDGRIALASAQKADFSQCSSWRTATWNPPGRRFPPTENPIGA